MTDDDAAAALVSLRQLANKMDVHRIGRVSDVEVDVDIELDTQPREVTEPPDFKDALDQDADARRFFDSLSFSNKNRFVFSIEDAKTAETRQRRIAKAVSTLREGRT